MVSPLISIVVCCYNRAHMLSRTIDSILSQHYQPIEIIVLDDGSTDITQQLMTQYKDKINYYHQANQGISVSRTNACKFANGEYIAFMDDDDLMPAERITQLYSALCQYPQAVYAVGDFAIIDTAGNFTGNRWLPEGKLSIKNPVLVEDAYDAVLRPTVPATVHTTLFRKADGEKIGWFDTQYRYASEDKDFFARLGKLGPIVYIPEIVSYYRRGHTSLTNNNQKALYDTLRLFENHLHSLPPQQLSLGNALKKRILSQLKKLASVTKEFGLQSDYIPADYPNKALSLLNFSDRLKYLWYNNIKLPARILLNKH